MNKNGFSLRFEPDPRTDLPHLVDDQGRLTAALRASWETELRARCNNQSLRAGEIIEFQANAKNLPRRFHIRAERGASNRMPTYILEPVEPAPSPTPATEPFPSWNGRIEPVSSPTPALAPTLDALGTAWVAGFLGELDKLILDVPFDRYGLHGVQVLRDELRDVAGSHPRELLLLLISGFALSGMLACSTDPAQARRGRCYENALEALNPALKNVASGSCGGIGALVGAFSRVLGLGRGV